MPGQTPRTRRRRCSTITISSVLQIIAAVSVVHVAASFSTRIVRGQICSLLHRGQTRTLYGDIFELRVGTLPTGCDTDPLRYAVHLRRVCLRKTRTAPEFAGACQRRDCISRCWAPIVFPAVANVTASRAILLLLFQLTVQLQGSGSGSTHAYIPSADRSYPEGRTPSNDDQQGRPVERPPFFAYNV